MSITAPTASLPVALCELVHETKGRCDGSRSAIFTLQTGLIVSNLESRRHLRASRWLPYLAMPQGSERGGPLEDTRRDRWSRRPRGRSVARRSSKIDYRRQEQGRRSIDYEAPPWFWSDQDDANIQIVGHPGGDAEIVRGYIANGRITTPSIRDNEVVEGIAVNAA